MGAARDEEFREAIAAQMDTILSCIVSHLMSGDTNLEHNAALLLGYCSSVSADFRQCFWRHEVAGDTMIARWMPLLTSSDHGLTTNVIWALRTLCADAHDPSALDGSGWQQIIATVSGMVEHVDPRVKAHACAMMQTINAARQSARSSTANDKPVSGGPMGLRRDKSMLAVNALTQLTKQDSPPATPTNDDLAQNKDDDSHKPKTNLSRSSKGRSRPSLLAPWKKAESRFSLVKSCKVPTAAIMEKTHSMIPAGHCAELAVLLSAAITQAAEG